MAVTDFVYARTALPTDISAQNNGAATPANDIGPFLCVTIDTTAANILPTAPCSGVVLSTTDDSIYGVTVENIQGAGGIGRVAQHGIAQCTASGAITVGQWVQADASGKVKTSVAAKPSVGLALMTTINNNDPILVLLHIARNA